MADAKISALSPASALAGTEVLPIVQSGSTKKVATDDLTVKNIRSNATTGLLQIAGPAAGTTRTMTVPDANFTAARTDAAQTFLGNQTFGNGSTFTQVALDSSAAGGADFAFRTGGLNRWLWSKSGAETGSNAGSDLLLYRYDDAGGYGGNPILVNRQNGQVTFEGNIVIKSAGNGINFAADAHATGMTSELLDDYEEGTWTATARCTGNATATTTVTGYYTKIGRVVTVGFRNLTNIDTSGMSGFFLVSLPFACMSGASAAFAGSCAFNSLAIPAGGNLVIPVAENGSTDILFRVAGDGYAGGLLGATQLTDDTTDIAYLSLTYFAA